MVGIVSGNGKKGRLLVLTAKAMENSRWDLSLKQRGEQLRISTFRTLRAGGLLVESQSWLPNQQRQAKVAFQHIYKETKRDKYEGTRERLQSTSSSLLRH